MVFLMLNLNDNALIESPSGNFFHSLNMYQTVQPVSYTHLDVYKRQIMDMQTEGDTTVIESRAPVAALFGFAGDIRSATEGRAMWSTEFAGFETLPTNLLSEVVGTIRQRKGLKKEIPQASDYLSM